jgi:prepilin-type processing-associated H-X9-DG protein
LFSERLVGDDHGQMITQGRDWYKGGPAVGSSAANTAKHRTQCMALAPPTSSSSTGNNWSEGGRNWAYGNLQVTRYNHVMPPNNKSCFPGAEPNKGGSTTASSNHPGGVNLGMVDGSVRFVNESVSPLIWERLGDRKDGQPVSDF